TCYLRGAKHLPLSPNKNKKQFFPKVAAHFSPTQNPPQLHDVSTTHARQILTSWLRDRLIQQQFEVEMEFGPKDLLSAISETARLVPGRIILEDALRQELDYRKLLAGGELLARAVERIAPSAQKRVGVLLPNVCALPVLLLGLWKLGRTPAILNFS